MLAWWTGSLSVIKHLLPYLFSLQTTQVLMVFVVREAMYFCSIQRISSCIISNSRSKYNVSASDVVVLIYAFRRLRCLRGLMSWITPSGGWSRGTEWMRWMLKRGHEHREKVFLPVVSTQWLKTWTALMCGSGGPSLQSKFNPLFSPQGAVFLEGISVKGVTQLTVQPKLGEIQRKCQEMSEWDR